MSWPCFERTMNPYKILYREESISVEMVWAIMNCLNEELFNTKIYTEVSSMEYLHSAIGGYQHLVTLRLSIMQCIDCISNAEYAPHLKQHSNFAGASSRSHRWKIWMKWFLKIRAFVINVQKFRDRNKFSSPACNFFICSKILLLLSTINSPSFLNICTARDAIKACLPF